MPHLHLKTESSKKTIRLHEDESVLSGLLRNDINVPHGCKAGICQSCIMISKDSIPPKAQKGLKEAHKQSGHFLACSCIPTQDMTIHFSDHADSYQTMVLAKEKLNNSILRLRVDKTFDYKPGQFCTLSNSQTGRCYSIASHPTLDDFIEFHIKIINQGQFSQWLLHSLRVGEKITISDPTGNCFYTSTQQSDTLLLAGVGTGLAPLYGITQDALEKKHSGDIHLVIGAKESSNFYYRKTLNALAEKYNQLTIHWLAQDSVKNTSSNNDIYSYTKALFPNYKNVKIFLCGADSFVKKMRKQCFLSGASMKNISADSFISSS